MGPGRGRTGRSCRHGRYLLRLYPNEGIDITPMLCSLWERPGARVAEEARVWRAARGRQSALGYDVNQCRRRRWQHEQHEQRNRPPLDAFRLAIVVVLTRVSAALLLALLDVLRAGGLAVV